MLRKKSSEKSSRLARALVPKSLFRCSIAGFRRGDRNDHYYQYSHLLLSGGRLEKLEEETNKRGVGINGEAG